MEALDVNKIRAVYVFGCLDDDQLQIVSGTSRILRAVEGERLFGFGQPAAKFYYLSSGQVRLFRVGPDGGEKVLRIVGAGETFAEATMFMNPAVYPVSAEAIEPTELWAFDVKTVTELLRESGDTCFRIMALMAKRLRCQLDDIDNLTLHNATFRLVSFLLMQVPSGVLESPHVELNTPKNVVASRLSIQPETFSRLLARLKAQGLVNVDGQQIVLEDIAALRRLIAP